MAHSTKPIELVQKGRKDLENIRRRYKRAGKEFVVNAAGDGDWSGVLPQEEFDKLRSKPNA